MRPFPDFFFHFRVHFSVTTDGYLSKVQDTDTSQYYSMTVFVLQYVSPVLFLDVSGILSAVYALQGDSCIELYIQWCAKV